MSKKLAAGAQAIVLDVKVGDGAFMKTLDDARHLAEAMLALGEQAGREVVCLLTDMDQPLGAAVGNALEVIEARATVRGEGPPDFTELVLDACARLLELSDLGVNFGEGFTMAERAMENGSAEEMWCRWIEAQGGTADESALERAPVVREVDGAARRLRVHLGAIAVGNAALHLGAGPADEGRTRSTTRSASSATQARRRGSRRARCSPRCTRATRPGGRGGAARCSRRTSSGPTAAERRILLEVLILELARRLTASAERPGYRVCVPELPEVETVRRALCAGARGAGLERVQIDDVRLTLPLDPAGVARRLRGERVAIRRPAREVPDAAVRVGARAARAPPHDRVVPAFALRQARRRRVPARDGAARRRLGAGSSDRSRG